MQRRCEICSNFLPEDRLEATDCRVEEHVFGGRLVALCGTHSHLVRHLRVTTLGGLRYLFRENQGRRSLIPRRSPALNEVTSERRIAGRRARDRLSN
jgi:hypothetical protein